MKSLMALVCGLTLSISAVGQQDWLTVASTDKGKWDIKAGSFEDSKTKGGIPIAVVIGRVTNSPSNQIDLYKWYVSLEDCGRHMGKFVTLGLDGSYRFENDFLIGSGTVASAVAASICAAYEYRVNERDKKGI